MQCLNTRCFCGLSLAGNQCQPPTVAHNSTARYLQALQHDQIIKVSSEITKGKHVFILSLKNLNIDITLYVNEMEYKPYFVNVDVQYVSMMYVYVRFKCCL